MKPIICALALCATLAPALAQDAATPPVATTQTQDAPEAVKLDNGLIVTPIVMPDDELQNISGVEMWRFLVQPPAPNTNFYARAELRKPGGNWQAIALDSIVGPSHDIKVTLGLMPIDGFSMTDAVKWKSMIHLREFQGEQTFNNTTSRGQLDNPVKDLQDVTASIIGSSPYVTPVIVRPNGEVTLMTFSSGPRNEYDKQVQSAELVLVFEAKPQTR